jgi:hypothetical protein
MKKLIEAVYKSIENKNYYGALFMALCLPDIFGKMQYPEINSKKGM